MKALNLLPLFLAGSMFAGCSEAMEDAPLDAEFGLETLDGKDDSFSIRPGSPEAEAVVKFVNQPIADDAAGVAFRDLIDTRIHATAAKNIAKFRAGTDGTFGTGDDKTFADLTALDRVPYVGRSTMMQLFELAEANGYFTRASLDCADYLAHDSSNRYYLRSYADLLEVGNSRCTTINGDLYIQITGTDILPPSAREIESLQHLVTVTGNVNITGSSIWNSLNFKSLETIGKDLAATYNTSAKHTLKFPALKNVNKIFLTRMQSTTFDALETAPEIRLYDTDATGFTALQTTSLLELNRTITGDVVVDFPALKTVDNLTFNYSRPSYTSYDVVYQGSFGKLATATNITMNYGKYAGLAFPALTDVPGSLVTTTSTDPYTGMTKLKNVGALSSNNDVFSAGSNAGPAVLTTAGSIRIAGGTDINGYNKLKHVDTVISANSRTDIQGSNALETIGASISLYPGRSTGATPGVYRLTNVTTLLIDMETQRRSGKRSKPREHRRFLDHHRQLHDRQHFLQKPRQRRRRHPRAESLWGHRPVPRVGHRTTGP
ncbi:MAG: hypothetical protein R3E66_10985 [bacterium]